MYSTTPARGDNRVVFWLPDAFDPADYPRPDDARYFVSTLILKTAREDVDAHGFATLNRRVLERVLDRNALTTTITTLASDGVITVDRKYFRGSISRGYRLTQDYRRQLPVIVKATDPLLIRRIERERERLAEEQLRWRLPIHDRLEADARLVSLAAGVEERLASLDCDVQQGQSVLVQRIKQRDYHFSVSKWGRCFNCITGVERSLRSFMRIDGREVGCIDVSCCQPALLALLIARLQSHPACHVQCTKTWTNSDHIPCPAGGGLLAALPVLPLPSVLPFVGLAELDDFSAEVQSGCLYDKLLKYLGWDVSERDRLKRAVLRDVLAKRGRYPSEVEDAFRDEFPGVWRFIRAVNRDDHSTLIRCLQKLEAWLVIEQVAPMIEVPIVTLHDGIYCRIQDRPIIERAFKMAFDYTGLRATFKPV